MTVYIFNFPLIFLETQTNLNATILIKDFLKKPMILYTRL